MRLAEEKISPDEAEITQAFIDLIGQTMQAKERETNGRLRRFAHPRTVACAHATFTVSADLPSDLQVGLFAQPATYEAWVRFGNNAFDTDDKKDIRGMSVKVLNIKRSEAPLLDLTHGLSEGLSEELSSNEQTQDFVMISHPTLVAGTPLNFYKMQSAVIAGRPLSFFLNPFDWHGREFRTVLKARQHHTSHLDIPYWSTTPYAFGDGRAVKYSFRPTSTHKTAEPTQRTPNHLRQAVQTHLADHVATFDLCVQFQTDPQTMPIEDALIEWDEAISPFVKVAELTINVQDITADENQEKGQALAFNPWHTTAAHRPLGGINRVRRAIYQAMAKLRATAP